MKNLTDFRKTVGTGVDPSLACSRLRNSGESEKSFKNKKTRAPPPLPSRARLIFALLSFNTSPLYYLRAWHRLIRSTPVSRAWNGIRYQFKKKE